jgi:hypothetical protein
MSDQETIESLRLANAALMREAEQRDKKDRERYLLDASITGELIKIGVRFPQRHPREKHMDIERLARLADGD